MPPSRGCSPPQCSPKVSRASVGARGAFSSASLPCQWGPFTTRHRLEADSTSHLCLAPASVTNVLPEPPSKVVSDGVGTGVSPAIGPGTCCAEPRGPAWGDPWFPCRCCPSRWGGGPRAGAQKKRQRAVTMEWGPCLLGCCWRMEHTCLPLFSHV